MSYNLHQLLHLIKSVIDWGPLWAHIGYPFEAENGRLKKSIHSANGVVHQIVRGISMVQTELIIKENVELIEDTPVFNFYSHLEKQRKQKSIQFHAARYFGRVSLPQERWINQLNLDDAYSLLYTKMVRNGCYYSADETDRTDCSCIYTTDGRFFEIQNFIVDTANEKEFLLCKNINCRPLSCSAIYKVDSLDNNIIAVETNLIESVCVFLKIEEEFYISIVPNTYHNY